MQLVYCAYLLYCDKKRGIIVIYNIQNLPYHTTLHAIIVGFVFAIDHSAPGGVMKSPKTVVQEFIYSFALIHKKAQIF